MDFWNFGRAIFSVTEDVYNNILLFVKGKLDLCNLICEKNYLNVLFSFHHSKCTIILSLYRRKNYSERVSEVLGVSA